MTRVDVGIEPCTLVDKHLQSAVREITRPINNCLRKLKEGKLDLSKQPKKFKLGEGHELFFYDKILYLVKRYSALQREYVRRYGDWFNKELYNIISDPLFKNNFPSYLWNDYEETLDDTKLLIDRIKERLNGKMKTFHYKSKSIEKNEAIKNIELNLHRYELNNIMNGYFKIIKPTTNIHERYKVYSTFERNSLYLLRQFEEDKMKLLTKYRSNNSFLDKVFIDYSSSPVIFDYVYKNILGIK